MRGDLFKNFQLAQSHQVAEPANGPMEGHIGKALGPLAQPLDRFERVQLEDVLSVCASAASLSEAGRILFSVSRENKAKSNDADRLRKYLARFGLSWDMIKKNDISTGLTKIFI